jgi:transglutaminase-like putative cysteine protease
MNKTAVRLAIAVIAALLPTMLSHILLDSGVGVLYLILFSLVSIAIAWGRTAVAKRLSVVFLAAQTIIYAVGVSVVIMSLNLTPASAYLAWFRIAQDGEASGMLSFMFTVKICFFSTVFASAIVRNGVIRPLAGSITMLLIVLYAVFQVPALGYGAAAALAVAVVALAIRGPRLFRRRNVRVLITLSVLAALAAIPLARIAPRPENPMVDTFDQGALSRAVVKVYPEFPFLYNMPGYGHQLGRKEISDRPSLTARPVFEVRGKPGQTVYLRTAVFEIYTGSGWAYNKNRLAQAEFSYGSIFKTSEADQFDNALRVDVLIDFFSSVPHTVNTSAILIGNGSVPELAYGSKDTGFLFEIPTVKGTSFLLQQGTAQSTAETPDEAYLQLPTNIPAGAIELARLLGESGVALETSAKIKDYLTYNYYYTLEPSREAQFDDPAWEFLLAAGEGYCVHFATSFVLLARMNGIPARYVTGFLVNIPYDTGSAKVTGFSSHAWAEIWDPELGWIVQEATPPMLPEFFDDPYFFEMYNPFGSNYTALQLESIMGDRVSRTSQSSGTRKPIDLNPAPFVLGLIAAAILAGMYYLFFHSIYTVGSPRRRISIISKRMIRRSSAEGVQGPATRGWIDWSKEIDAKHMPSSKHLDRAIKLMQAGFFGGRSNGRREVRFIRQTYRRVFGRKLTSRHFVK